MENDRQLQAKEFITASRPRLTTDRRELSAYEMACLRLAIEEGTAPPPASAPETIDVADFVESPNETALDDGSYRVRARLVSVVKPMHESWYEIRVGRRHRFAYTCVKEAARAFNRLNAQNLQPTGWISSNGGRPEPPTVPRQRGIFAELPRILGWQLSHGY